jgi:H+-translocating NAD(P) transhydrogenase subunit alpha
MIIGVVLDARQGETRVAATPTTVAKLIAGVDVVVDAEAGRVEDILRAL